jgi:hypothetical protein
MFNKEDFQNNYDVEIYNSEVVCDPLDDVNMYDSPLEVYKICFPNDRTPKASLNNIYRDVFSAYLNKKNKLSISEIENIVTSSRRGMSKLDMDIYVKAVIEGEFQVMLEAETSISMDIIQSCSINELKDKETMAERLTFIRSEPADLSDYTLYNSKLITGRALWKD